MLNGASVLLAALIGFEIHSVHQLADVTELLQRAQAPLVQAQQQEPQIQRLVQRTALGATRDPALQDMLTKYGFALTIKPNALTPAAPTEPPPHS
jgi:hypothetical protein